MSRVRFHAWRLDLRWLLLAGLLVISFAVAMVSLRGERGSNTPQLRNPSPPTVGYGTLPSQPREGPLVFSTMTDHRRTPS